MDEETEYYYYVRAINEVGAGDDAYARIVTVLQTEGVPRGPRNLRANEHTRGEVTLTWSAPPDEGSSPVTGYKIVREYREGTSKVVSALASDTGSTSTSYVDDTVDEETEYYYYVRAINEAGVGDDAHVRIVTVLQAKPDPEPTPEPVRPVRPAGVSISTQPGSLDVSVDWRDVAGATSYLARWREGGAGNRLNEGVEVQSSDADITVSDYGKWVVRVEACNSAGCGPGNSKRFEVELSKPTSETILPPSKARTPRKPQALAAKRTSRNAVTLTWTAPEDDGGSPITGYNIVRAAGAQTVTIAEDTASTSTSYVDDTVEEETTYFYMVRAINDAGVGDYSLMAVETSLQTEGVPGAPRNLNVSEPTRGEVTLTWNAPSDAGSSAITGYNIVRQSRGQIVTVAEDTASTSTSYVDDTVEEETTYYYMVRAINDAGVGDDTMRMIETRLQSVDVPGPPRNLRVSEPTRGEITLTWTAPSNDGGFPITGYNIVRAAGAQTVTIAEDTASTSTSYVDDTVEEEATYFYYVRAVNDAGAGDDVMSMIETALQTEGLPRGPRNLRANEHTRGEVTLTWTAPSDDGGFPITGYNIVRQNGLQIVTIAEDTASTSTSYVDDTVEEETTYYYYVRAINEVGVGDDGFTLIDTKLQTEGVPGQPGRN